MKKSPKLFLPTFYNRYEYVRNCLERKLLDSTYQKLGTVLHLGCGEGDYDPMLCSLSHKVIACDVNELDLRRAFIKNGWIPGLSYQIEDATLLTFDDCCFDAVVSVDVLEHVASPEKMLMEIYRVLRPGGFAIVTFPNQHFPFFYDPVNWLLVKLIKKHISIGAYSFGHNWLPVRGEILSLALISGFRVINFSSLSFSLVALAEMYWVGFLQAVLKSNSSNSSCFPSEDRDSLSIKLAQASLVQYRGGLDERIQLALRHCTNWICALDRHCCYLSGDGVNTGVILEKKIS